MAPPGEGTGDWARAQGLCLPHSSPHMVGPIGRLGGRETRVRTVSKLSTLSLLRSPTSPHAVPSAVPGGGRLGSRRRRGRRISWWHDKASTAPASVTACWYPTWCLCRRIRGERDDRVEVERRGFPSQMPPRSSSSSNDLASGRRGKGRRGPCSTSTRRRAAAVEAPHAASIRKGEGCAARVRARERLQWSGREAPLAQIAGFATACARIKPRTTRPRAHARKGRSRGTRTGAVIVAAGSSARRGRAEPGKLPPPPSRASSAAGDEPRRGSCRRLLPARRPGPKELRTPNGAPPRAIEQPPCLCVDPQGRKRHRLGRARMRRTPAREGCAAGSSRARTCRCVESPLPVLILCAPPPAPHRDLSARVTACSPRSIPLRRFPLLSGLERENTDGITGLESDRFTDSRWREATRVNGREKYPCCFTVYVQLNRDRNQMEIL
ncbi:unnamed protein product [Urochloa humidicola]